MWVYVEWPNFSDSAALALVQRVILLAYESDCIVSALLKEVARERPAIATLPAVDKDRFSALLRLREAWQKKWDARVASEWKISFCVWTILALGVAQTLQHHTVLWVLPIAVVFAHGYILLCIRRKNTQDGKICLHYLRAAEGIYLPNSVLPDPKIHQKPSTMETWLHPVFIAQMMASLILCAAILFP